MFCPHCGALASDGTKFCANCGKSLSNEPTVEPVIVPTVLPKEDPKSTTDRISYSDYYPGIGTVNNPTTNETVADSGNVLSKRKFLKLPENTVLKKNINSAAIICYICAAITLGFTAIAGDINFIDPILLVVLGLFIHIGSSVIASFILLAYGIFNVYVMFVQTGKFGGYLVAVAGVTAVIYTIKTAIIYHKYKKSAKQ